MIFYIINLSLKLESVLLLDILLYGYPGCGKTYIVLSLANLF